MKRVHNGIAFLTIRCSGCCLGPFECSRFILGHRTASEGNPAAMEETEDERADNALQRAVEENNTGAVAEALVHVGGAADVRWTASFTAAQTAVAKGHMECFQLVLERLGQAFPIAVGNNGGALSEDEEIDERQEAEEEIAESYGMAPHRINKHVLHQWRLLFSAVLEAGSKEAMRKFLLATPERILMSVSCIGKLLQQYPVWEEEIELLLKNRGSPALIVRAFASLRRWGMESYATEAAEMLLQHSTKEAFLYFDGSRVSILSSVMDFCDRIPEGLTLAVLEAAPVEQFRCHGNNSRAAGRSAFTSWLWAATMRGTDAIFEKVASLSNRETVLGVTRREGTVFHAAIQHKAPLGRIMRIYELSGNDRHLLEMSSDAMSTPLQLVLRHHTPDVLEWLLEVGDASAFDKMIEKNILYCSILDSGRDKHWINFETTLRVVQRRWPVQLPDMLSEQCKPPPSLPWNPLPCTVLSALVLKCEASQVETVLELMSEVCPEAITSAGETGATALHWAVQAKCPAKVALLLPLFDHSARNQRSSFFMDCTALEVAEKMNDDCASKQDIVRLFGPRAKGAE